MYLTSIFCPLVFPHNVPGLVWSELSRKVPGELCQQRCQRNILDRWQIGNLLSIQDLLYKSRATFPIYLGRKEKKYYIQCLKSLHKRHVWMLWSMLFIVQHQGLDKHWSDRPSFGPDLPQLSVSVWSSKANISDTKIDPSRFRWNKTCKVW